ncbi:hypothetical protein MGYG_05186 [Nannizzia gypsea CBS 118893]|uniref:Uncharacterized protein n=1 Tax=Arthroderma gypseum (strain ATCC MYA-4604 / CBS 118893) TaxID=535722 RepID=E4UYM0_ARTGP|nr:hypothetical protein MGYG_05186 [Nannizzia gypsea CBS 118893]EFR02183.1 hypothetical protein MGYG_05186 [Nannizzia gypsea CBS 118893]
MGSAFSSTREQETLEYRPPPTPPEYDNPPPSLDWMRSPDGYKKRTTCYSRNGYVIYGYPSRGPKGEAIKDSIIAKTGVDIVDLKFLGFDIFAPPKERLPSQEAEDRFCGLLRKLGGRHWRSYHALFNGTVDEMTAERDDGIKWYFAWPGIDEHPNARNLEYTVSKDVAEGGGMVEEGGVWALENIPWNHIEFGKLRMCLTMEEKVQVMKELGAVFYPDPRDCPPLADLYSARNVSPKAPIEQTT